MKLVLSLNATVILCKKTGENHEYQFFRVFCAPQTTMGHYGRDGLTHLMLTTAFLQFQPEDHLEPCNEVGSLSPVKHLVAFETKTF